MATIQLIRPLDQPIGTRRLLEELKKGLQDTRFNSLRMIVAYAKSGPLLRLREFLEAWCNAGKTIEAIVGIDQKGTSREAIELTQTLFNAVYVTREGGITFHPKLYIFTGDTYGRAFIGSNNLTAGGTETNFESAIQLDLELPTDASLLQALEEAWKDLLPATCPATSVLDATLLAKLVADGDVISEQAMRSGNHDPEGTQTTRGRMPRSGLKLKPGSPLPRKAPAARPRTHALSAGGAAGAAAAATQPTEPASARGFAIQIKPHHNGEIFLIVTAALQNPAFFHWPFTGTTTPKKPGNPSYPQLDPDPVGGITESCGWRA